MLNERQKIKDGTNEINTPEGEIDISGFIIPQFRFISYRLKETSVNENDYNTALSKFGINNIKYPFDKIQPINNARNTLYEQILRRGETISHTNERIYSVGRAFFEKMEANLGVLETENRDHKSDHYPFPVTLTAFRILNLIDTGADSAIILEKLNKNRSIIRLKQWDKHLATKYNDFTSLLHLRDKPLEIAAKLARQYLLFEYILKDVFLESSVMTSGESLSVFEIRKILQKLQGDYWITAQEYYDENEDNTWKDVFGRMTKEENNIGIPNKYTSFASFERSRIRNTKKKLARLTEDNN